jgi:hypothetical protein
MGQGANQSIVIWQYALNASWVLLPLVPAVLIYLIFPRTETSLAGPFKGLTIRSSGAFAAYFLVLLATLPLLNRQNNNLETLLRPTWVITGHISLVDEKGKPLKLPNPGISSVAVDLDPNFVRATGHTGFALTVPEIDQRVPRLLIKYPGFASYWLDPDNPEGDDNAKIDRSRRTIDFTKPIVVKREACVGLSCGQPQ